MPHGGIKDVTEECFQQNPLEFEGDDQWVVYRWDKPAKNDNKKVDLQNIKQTINKKNFLQNTNLIFRADAHSGHRTRVSANRTTEGTFPPGSMWTMNPLFPS